MGKTAKIIILIALVVAVGIVFVLKEKDRDSELGLTVADRPAGEKAAPAIPGALPRLVDVGADKCIPCKMMAPILEELRKEYAGIFQVEFIDVWKNPADGKKFGVRIIPTQIFFDAAGKELFRHQGFFSKEDILAKWKELGIKPEKI